MNFRYNFRNNIWLRIFKFSGNNRYRSTSDIRHEFESLSGSLATDMDPFLSNISSQGDSGAYSSEFDFSCKSCGKTYKYKQSLSLHKRVYCGKEPTMQCPLCPKKCYRKRDFQAHYRQYHPEHLSDLFLTNCAKYNNIALS